MAVQIAQSKVFDEYIKNLAKRIPVVAIVINMFAINTVFADCVNQEYIVPYMIIITTFTFLWELWFICTSYNDVMKTMKFSCNCISYITFTLFFRMIAFLVVANFSSAGQPMRCVVNFPPEILVLMGMLFAALVYLSDKIELYFWKSLIDKLDSAEEYENNVMGGGSYQIDNKSRHSIIVTQLPFPTPANTAVTTGVTSAINGIPNPKLLPPGLNSLNASLLVPPKTADSPV